MSFLPANLKILQKWKFAIFLIIVLVVYWPTFTGDFILDDKFLVKNNPYITQMQSIASYFIQEDGIFDLDDLGVLHTGYYRPLINITYFLDYKVWGMNAYGFRITNLFFHILSCLMLYKLINFFIKDKRTTFWCVLLFSIHPVNTESVSFIVARNNILVTLFSVSSFYFYITGNERGEPGKKFISIVLFACAVFTKEFGIMILPVFFLYNRFLVSNKRSISDEILSYLPFVFIAIVYFYLRHMVTGNVFTPFDSPSLLKRIYFVPYVVMWNLKLIVMPYGLHQFSVSYPSSLYNPWVIIAVIMLVLISIFICVRKNNKILIFSYISFLTALFPVSGIISSAATSTTLVSLRWLYFPLIFFMLGLGNILNQYIDMKQGLKRAISCVMICYLGIYSFCLNKYHWHDEGTFFSQEVLIHNNMSNAGGFAEYLFDNGNIAEAEKYFKIAINEYPHQSYNYINYSALLLKKNDYKDAIFYLKKAANLLMTNIEQAEWHNNMGFALLGTGDTVDSLKHFNRSVVLAPDNAGFWANLGSAYGMIGEYKESVKAFKRGIAISPELISLRVYLSMSYINLKDYENAISTLEGIPAKEMMGNKEILRLLQIARNGLSQESSDLSK